MCVWMIGGVRILDRSFVRGHACLVKTLAVCIVTAQPEMNSATDGCKSSYIQYYYYQPTVRMHGACVVGSLFPITSKQAIPKLVFSLVQIKTCFKDTRPGGSVHYSYCCILFRLY
jgi:hypothetical protein